VLFHGLALEKNGLFQCPEELLVRAGFFDSLQVELCAGPHDELGFPARANCGSEADEIATVLKWTPRMDIACQEEECVWAIEEIGWVCAVGLFNFDKLLPGDNPQLFIQHFHIEVQVLHRGNDGFEHPPSVRGIKRACLRSSDFELARFRQPDLLPRVPLVLVPRFVGRTALDQE
jgi:hypothetical protein